MTAMPDKPPRRRLLRCRSGVAMIEFVIILPVLLLLFLGVVELTRYIMIHQKLDKAVNSAADFVTQRTEIRVSDLNDIRAAVPQIMSPYAFNGSVVFTSAAFFIAPVAPCVGANVTCITWQNGADSRLGTTGGNLNTAAIGGYRVIQGQNIIVAEIVYRYQPLLGITASDNFLGVPLLTALVPHAIYKYAVYKPRQGTLLDIKP